MAIYDYAYYINGRYIAFLRKSVASAYDPYLDYNEMYLTPTTDDTEAILVEYSYQPSTVSAESATLDVNSRLALAVVDYVKHRLAEDRGDDRSSQKFYNAFKRRVSRNHRDKLGTQAQMMPYGLGVCK